MQRNERKSSRSVDSVGFRRQRVQLISHTDVGIFIKRRKSKQANCLMQQTVGPTEKAILNFIKIQGKSSRELSEKFFLSVFLSPTIVKNFKFNLVSLLHMKWDSNCKLKTFEIRRHHSQCTKQFTRHSEANGSSRNETKNCLTSAALSGKVDWDEKRLQTKNVNYRKRLCFPPVWTLPEFPSAPTTKTTAASEEESSWVR